MRAWLLSITLLVGAVVWSALCPKPQLSECVRDNKKDGCHRLILGFVQAMIENANKTSTEMHLESRCTLRLCCFQLWADQYRLSTFHSQVVSMCSAGSSTWESERLDEYVSL